MPPESYACSVCGFPLGEFSALRGIEFHGKVICGDCAQKANPEYRKWKADQAGIA